MSATTERSLLAELLPLSARALAARFSAGHPIAPPDIAGFAYRGTSLGLPASIERLTWKKFQKVFLDDPALGAVRGYNVQVQQNGVTEPSVPRTRRGRPAVFGHFVVKDAAGYAVPRPSPGGVILDYARGGNGWPSPLAALRDPLVSLAPGDATWLLGYSYLELGPARLPTPSYFLLVREGPVVDRAARPSGMRP